MFNGVSTLTSWGAMDLHHAGRAQEPMALPGSTYAGQRYFKSSGAAFYLAGKGEG